MRFFIKNVQGLKDIGLAYRKGKGPGQKWFIHYKMFIPIVLSFNNNIMEQIVICAMDNVNKECLLNSLSNANRINMFEGKYKTYIAIDNVTKLYKVGKTCHLSRRLSSLRTSNTNIDIVYYIEIDIEKEIHTLLRGFRKNREWFDVDEFIIEGVAKKYKLKKYTE